MYVSNVVKNLGKTSFLSLIVASGVLLYSNSAFSSSKTCWCNDDGQWAGTEASCCDTKTMCIFQEGGEGSSTCSGEVTADDGESGYYCPNDANFQVCLIQPTR